MILYDFYNQFTVNLVLVDFFFSSLQICFSPLFSISSDPIGSNI